MEQKDSDVKIEEKKRSQKCCQFLRSHETTLKVGAPRQHFSVTGSIKPTVKVFNLMKHTKSKKKNISSKTQIN